MLLVLFTLKQTTYACLPVALVLHCVVDFVDLLRKHVKLGDDEFLPEGLDQQYHIPTDTPGRKTTQFRDTH